MLPEALRFRVGLIDQISAPLGNIQRQLNSVTNTYRQGTHTMVAGATGMVGAGFALQQALMPAIEMDRKLGEVKSLGVADDQLKTLAQTAMQFSVEYGKSATEFVAASYDIKSAMGDLSGEELSNLTKTAAITAAATKADTKTITDYFGTMYGIFKDQANVIGKDAWADQLGSYTALAVERFKTDGVKLSQSFKALGNDATNAGAGLGEQFAILGLLGNQMDGGVAATKYQAFISKAAGAGKNLGLNFLDSNNKLLDAASIIDVIRGKYGDSLDALEKMKIEKAFGGKEAMSFISTLYGQTGELRKQIEDFSNISGIEQAKQMAGAMTDQWERLEQGVFAVRTAFGAALLPSLLPVVSTLADGAMEIIEWTEMFPNLTRVMGKGALTILGLVAAGGALTMIWGIGKQALAGYSLVFKGLIAVKKGYLALMRLVRIALFAASMQMNMYGVKAKIVTAAQWVLNSSMLAASAAYRMAATGLSWLGMAFLKGATAALKFTVALLTNPIFLIAAGVMAAIAAVGALIYYWDDLKASFGDTTWFQIIDGAVSFVSASFRALFDFLAAGWQWVMEAFTQNSGFAFIGQMADNLRNVFSSVFNWIYEKLNGIWETVKSLTDWIPGFGNDDELELKSKSIQSATPTLQVQPGGAAKSIANYQTSSTNYGGVAIYPTYMNNVSDFESEMMMVAG
ncbi:phage tail tape measure protein [Vibrio vulnificus]|uniref:phage tail tape measure protein n=1 Tax=Vibrio vulnificus TaxID=672 RepID=UPI003EDA28B5